jgi:hypothetical protein
MQPRGCATLAEAPAPFVLVYTNVVWRERVPDTTAVLNFDRGNLVASVHARERNHHCAISRKHAPATTPITGLLDGLIAAEQILRATRGGDEKRPSSRNSHGTCAAGSRLARGPRSRADPFLRSRKPTFRSGARDRQARSKRCRDGAALRVPPATRADSLLLAKLRGDVVHDVIRAC